MRIADLIKMALRNLKRRKARTALTVVGVVIGTISIVVMVSLGIGLNYSFEKSMMESGGVNTLSIYPYTYEQGEDGEGSEVDQKNLMNDEFIEVLKQIDHVKYVSPVIQVPITVYGSGWESNAQLQVVDFSIIPEMDPPDPESGTYDFASGTDSIILGKESLYYRHRPNSEQQITSELDLSKEKLFFTFDDLNVQDNNQDSNTEEGPTSEIGTMDSSMQSSPKGMVTKQKKQLIKNMAVVNDTYAYQFQYSAFMDVTYFRDLYEKQARLLPSKDRKRALSCLKSYSEIRLIVDNAKNVNGVTEKVKEYGAKPEGIGNYIEQVKKTANIIEMVLGGIGAVSMLVSAISIANTMIMSIYERTKEIGVMKVLGCVVSDIKKLFLIEAGTIGAIGGIIGLMFSYLISYIINHFLGSAFGSFMGVAPENAQTMRMSIIPIWLSLIALGFAFLVGVISGYIPARRATKISSIEAMKSEG